MRNIRDDGYPHGYQLIKEAMVREIRDATRWSSIEEAWMALQHVRIMAEAMKNEYVKHFAEECTIPARANQDTCHSGLGSIFRAKDVDKSE